MATPKPTTAALQAEALAARAREQTFDPKEIRLSEAGQCGRRQTLRALGYEPAPHTLRELAIFETGHLVEDRLLGYWEDRYPGQVLRQVEVRTPFGTGHIDGYVEPLRHLVECKTTTEKHRDHLPLASHVDQVTLYLHFWGHGRGADAEITYYVKETGQVLSFPVSYDPDRAEALIQNLIAVQAAIQLLQEPLPVPEDYQATRYPCAWYTPEGLARCPYWRHCWGDRIVAGRDPRPPAPPPPVLEAPELARDLAAYAALRQQLTAVQRHLDTVKAELATYEAGFAQLLDEAGAHVLRADGLEVRRTPVAGRTTWDVDRAIADGVVDAAALEPYRKVGAGYTRWTVRPIPGARKNE
ncbi:MAG: hypothetical protein OWV35_11455 [Firmicutes bacterium]|nr:hypothetical protein [Bacillota bacterium]